VLSVTDARPGKLGLPQEVDIAAAKGEGGEAGMLGRQRDRHDGLRVGKNLIFGKTSRRQSPSTRPLSWAADDALTPAIVKATGHTGLLSHARAATVVLGLRDFWRPGPPPQQAVRVVDRRPAIRLPGVQLLDWAGRLQGRDDCCVVRGAGTPHRSKPPPPKTGRPDNWMSCWQPLPLSRDQGLVRWANGPRACPE